EEGTLTATVQDDNGKIATGQVEVRTHAHEFTECTVGDDRDPFFYCALMPWLCGPPPGAIRTACTDPLLISASLTENGSVTALFNLGRYAFGKTAGRLSIQESNPTNLLTTPSCLRYFFDTGGECQVITNNAGIRQVKAPEGLADVVTNTAWRYYI